MLAAGSSIRRSSLATTRSGEKQQPLTNAVNERGRQVGVGDEFLGAGQPADAVTRLDHLGRISLRQPEQMNHDRERRMVEVEQPAVIELPWQVRAADP